MDPSIIAGGGAFLLVLTHFSADKLNLPYIPRSKWLSAAGGISVAYIFVHAFPELNEFQEIAKESELFNSVQFLEHHLYLIALLGLTFFYGLERAAKLSYQSHRDDEIKKEPHNIKIFWVHIFSFCIYNFLIGYLLLHRQGSDLQGLILFVIAMAFHFLVTDYGLLDHYQESYKKKGRWMIAASVLTGYGVGALTEIKEVYVGIVFAFIAGGVIMNVLKEELPENRKSTYWAFLLGLAGYSVLLLSI